MFRTVPQGGRPAGNGALAVWPLFIRILLGFLFEVYDLPAFQGPTTHKFKVAMKSLFRTKPLFFPALCVPYMSDCSLVGSSGLCLNPVPL